MKTSLPSGGELTFYGAASTDRDDSDDGSSGVDFRLECDLCTAGCGGPGRALRLIPPCVWLFQSGGVLFRVPPSAAVVVIWARRAALLGSSQYLFYPFAGIRLPGGMGSGGRLSSPMVSRGCGVYWPVSWAIWA